MPIRPISKLWIHVHTSREIRVLFLHVCGTRKLTTINVKWAFQKLMLQKIYLGNLSSIRGKLTLHLPPVENSRSFIFGRTNNSVLIFVNSKVRDRYNPGVSGYFITTFYDLKVTCSLTESNLPDSFTTLDLY